MRKSKRRSVVKRAKIQAGQFDFWKRGSAAKAAQQSSMRSTKPLTSFPKKTRKAEMRRCAIRGAY
jgi:hypothetical protein